MADAAGRIGTLEVRCPCGKSFENADTYLRHKRLCVTHQKEENVIFTTPKPNQRTAPVPARASSPKLVACWCGRRFKNNHALREHGCHHTVHKQQMNVHSASDSTQAPESYSGAGLISTERERPIPPVEASAKNIHCPCGRSFAKEKALNDHLRYSKTHQVAKSKATTPGSVPFTARHTRSNSSSLAPGPVPGTIPLSMLSVASLLRCTCGHAFETQRILDLHKRDSLYHKRQADQASTRNEQWNDSLASAFASLNLESVPTRARPSVAGCSCICGRKFTDQRALEQHKRDARRPWQGKGERKLKTFETPRPQYQEDEYLRDMAAAIAQQ